MSPVWGSKRGNMRTLEERFWPKTKQVGDCLVWTAYTNPAGYGQLRVNHKGIRAHRVAWELTYGPIPIGMHVLHRCDNPPCVKLDHLFIGTHKDNMNDRDIKGRGNPQKGEICHKAKLKAIDIPVIRQRYANGETQIVIAKSFGVASNTISQIVTNKIWRDLLS